MYYGFPDQGHALTSPFLGMGGGFKWGVLICKDEGFPWFQEHLCPRDVVLTNYYMLGALAQKEHQSMNASRILCVWGTQPMRVMKQNSSPLKVQIVVKLKIAVGCAPDTDHDTVGPLPYEPFFF